MKERNGKIWKESVKQSELNERKFKERKKCRKEMNGKHCITSKTENSKE